MAVTTTPDRNTHLSIRFVVPNRVARRLADAIGGTHATVSNLPPGRPGQPDDVVLTLRGDVAAAWATRPDGFDLGAGRQTPSGSFGAATYGFFGPTSDAALG
jgi:hypothetical protein